MISLGTFLLMRINSNPLSGGWVHDVQFSADGEKLAYVAHDSSITIVNSANGNAYVSKWLGG